jgi:hypothetical protein
VALDDILQEHSQTGPGPTITQRKLFEGYLERIEDFSGYGRAKVDSRQLEEASRTEGALGGSKDLEILLTADRGSEVDAPQSLQIKYVKQKSRDNVHYCQENTEKNEEQTKNIKVIHMIQTRGK